MRFDVGTTTNKTGMSGRNRLRLWMLVGSLGIVLAAMNQLRQEETIEQLDQLFGVTNDSRPAGSAGSASDGLDPQQKGVNSKNRMSQASSSFMATEATTETDKAVTGSIEDNTYFRPEERKAWFEVFEKLETTSPDQLREESIGDVAYAQFVNQPDEYRHQIVTVSGTLVREELQRPGTNPLGIESYHRLWISPKGGGQWPIVIFCRELPNDFPLGDRLSEKVSVVGSFFKNWSYSYGEGLGLAPVVLANSIEWEKPPNKSTGKELPVVQLLWATAGAGVLALGVVWIAVRRTMRPARIYRELPLDLTEAKLPAQGPRGDDHE